MKRMCCLILIMRLILSNGVYCNALESSTHQGQISEDAAAILNEQMDTSERAMLLDTEYYEASMEGLQLANHPIIRVYTEVFYDRASDSLMDIKLYADTYRISEYIVFGDEVLRIRKTEASDGRKIGINKRYNDYPQYIADIMNITRTTDFYGENCYINEICCFDGITSRQGVVVYMVTDKGTFVVYYEDANSTGILFTEAEYQQYACDYYAYISAPENNYDQNGEMLGGYRDSFLSYMKSKYDTTKFASYIVCNDLRNDNTDNTRHLPQSLAPAFFSVAAGTIILCFLVLFVYIHRKKKVSK